MLSKILEKAHMLAADTRHIHHIRHVQDNLRCYKTSQMAWHRRCCHRSPLKATSIIWDVVEIGYARRPTSAMAHRFEASIKVCNTPPAVVACR